MLKIALTACLVLLVVISLLPAVLAGEEERSPNPMWERMRGWDTSGDGKITRDEFRGADRLWQRLDQDGNGEVTEAEAAKARGGRQRGGRSADAGPSTRPGTPGLVLEHVDADCDGMVTRTEWAAFFESIDLDGDGAVSKEEWARAANPPSRASGEAPTVGQAAPKVKAVTLDGRTVVDLANPTRATVLVFGSWT